MREREPNLSHLVRYSDIIYLCYINYDIGVTLTPTPTVMSSSISISSTSTDIFHILTMTFISYI